MNAIETNRYTRTWRAIGAGMLRPRAILMVSAHWYVNATAVTAMTHPRTIHDFHGFPPELYQIRYPAPGLPELAAEVSEVVKPHPVVADEHSWGLDHGTWSVLMHAFPDADVPVVQLSIDARQPPDFHFELGARLAALARSGVLLMGSGNIVHNLRAMDWGRPDGAFDWAVRFNERACRVLTEQPEDAASLVQDRDFPEAAPTPEHFLPVLYLAGFATATGAKVVPRLADGYAYGSLSMTCYTLEA